METVLRNIVTLSITINCSYDVVFEYLSNPLNQKEWAIHFFEDIEEKDGKFIATLPFGKLPLDVKTDFETGIVDIYLGDGKPIRTRIVHVEDSICQYNFTLAQPKDMPNKVWQNEALPNMQDELNILKSILETK